MKYRLIFLRYVVQITCQQMSYAFRYRNFWKDRNCQYLEVVCVESTFNHLEPNG
jgi:hypothetical protein